jgi:predicted nucleic acid-binding protein
LNGNIADFEDAVAYYAAQALDLDIVVTRNGKDFDNSKISVMLPATFLTSPKAL